MHPVGAGEPRELDLSPQPEADVAAALGQLVVLAARIANQARGGEILVSALVKELTESAADVHFGGGRTVRLKGLAGPRTVYDVSWAGS